MRTAIEGATAGSHLYSACIPCTGSMSLNGDRLGFAPLIELSMEPVEGTATRVKLTWEYYESAANTGIPYPITVYIRSEEFEHEVV